MDSDTPSPQDPARYSKPKSESPIIDLEAEKPTAEKAASAKPGDTDQASAATPHKHDTIRVNKKETSRLPVGGFFGGVIGGGIAALGVLGYAYLTDPASSRLTALQHTLSEKPDRTELAALDARIATLETAIADTKAALAAASLKKSVEPDSELGKRMMALEAALKSIKMTVPQSAASSDHRTMKLALLLSMRDSLRNDNSAIREISALEKLGEASAAFLKLKSGLASALVPYEELHADVLKQIKALSLPRDERQDVPSTQSRFSSFFSQLVTVRPASTVTPKISATDIEFTPLLDALESDDANTALVALAALPQTERDLFKEIAGELQRHADVERALTDLLAETLEAMAQGDAP